MLNRLPKAIHMLSSCSVVGFKSKLDSHLRNIVGLPCRPGFNNSLDGGDCLHGGHYADDQGGQLDATKQSKETKVSKYPLSCNSDVSSNNTIRVLHKSSMI